VRPTVCLVTIALAALAAASCSPAQDQGAGDAAATAPAIPTAPADVAGPGRGPGFFAVDQTVDAMLERTRSRFQRIDADGDGKLTPEEMQAGQPAAAQANGQAAPGGQGPRGGFARADADGDGAVTLAEAEAQTRERFERLDVDKDGVVNRDELIAAFPRRGAGVPADD